MAQASRAGRTLVVLGSDREAIRGELGLLGGNAMSDSRDRPGIPTQPASRGVDFVVNENYPLGMLTSIQAGLRALPADAQAAIVLLSDQPFLASRVIDAVIAAYEAGPNGIVIPTFQGRRGHPILVDLKYRDEVLAIDPTEGLRRLMLVHPDDILEVDVGDGNILRDLDTPEDYKEGGIGLNMRRNPKRT
jgi:CTP:molybdopterin cytidylyltransferase MocA